MGLLARIQAEQERQKRGSWQVATANASVNKVTRSPWVELAIEKKLPAKELTNA
jgi:hypothetical protein